MAQQVNMITTQDILSGNRQNLFGNYSMDAKGNNEVGAWLRRLSQGAGENAAYGLGFQNSLEPQRESAITGLINNLNPANQVANAQGVGQSLIRQSANQGTQNAARLAQMGFGAGTQGGAVQDALNQGTRANNAAIFQANSPQAQTQSLQDILMAIQQAPGQGLNQLLQMFSPIETRQQANYAQHQNGGLGGAFGGLLGTALGGIDWTSLFTPKKIVNLGGIGT